MVSKVSGCMVIFDLYNQMNISMIDLTTPWGREMALKTYLEVIG